MVPRRGFAWLWHDLTTLAPYDFELTYVDLTTLAGIAALHGTRTPKVSATALPAAGRANMGQAAVRHVLASVTVKAKKLFVLLRTEVSAAMTLHVPRCCRCACVHLLVLPWASLSSLRHPCFSQLSSPRVSVAILQSGVR